MSRKLGDGETGTALVGEERTASIEVGEVGGGRRRGRWERPGGRQTANRGEELQLLGHLADR